ncbi:hypothetical protein AA958_34090 [Streptomyces sp. CNQ-509]|nr:hypothetical protein AA958_34090 [Streptomyces sp. CNQ-509]
MSRKSEEYILIARARQAATSFSEHRKQSVGQPELAHVVELGDLREQGVQTHRARVALECGQQGGPRLVVLGHQGQQQGVAGWEAH